MVVRPIHDVAFAIASALTEKMERRLQDGELPSFHEMVYQTAKTALTNYEKQREREGARVRGAFGTGATGNELETREPDSAGHGL